jgi:membrane associated rhomboid family serine protease
MFQSIWEDVKREFQHGNMVTRIIILNCFVFIFVNIVALFLKRPGADPLVFDSFMQYIGTPANPTNLLFRPWTLLTAGFTHIGFGHFIWNMLGFYWFGRIVGDLLGNHRVLPLYVLSAICGSLIFFLVANFTPYSIRFSDDSYAIGASAAVMAMMACAAKVAPDYIFNVLFIGPVKLKFIAFALIFLDLIGIANSSNTGGHFAHLGGVAFGLIFATNLKNGVDLGKPINTFMQYITNLLNGRKNKNFKYQKGEKEYARSEKSGQYTSSKGSRRSDTEGGGTDQERLDLILDKIKDKGYDSLTKEEKEFLFKVSKK